MTTTLAATYTGPKAADPSTLLILKQEDWPETTGAISIQEMLRIIGSTIVATDYEPDIDCAVSGGVLGCTVYAYPLVAGLDYRLLASWGSLSGPHVDMVEIEELVQFRLTDEASPEYPARAITSVAWADDCYGPDGEIIPQPTLTTDGEQVLSSTTVYGTAEIRYLCERHTYQLTAPRREVAYEDNFGSVLVGIYDGGIVSLDIELPPGIDAFEEDEDADCGSSWHGSLIDDDDQQDVPEAQPASRTTRIDYCTQQTISDIYA